MDWIYLSPHFDDVALSCGGLIWEQVRAGEAVTVWTVCAGSPPPGRISPFAQALHARWQTGESAAERRKQEDLVACQLLGTSSHYLNYPDCIYRRHPETGEFLYASEGALNGAVHPGDHEMLGSLQGALRHSTLPGATLVSPLAIGNHVDHQLTRLALEGLGCPLWYYADYPYIEQHGSQLEQLSQAGWESRVFPVSPGGLLAWEDSIAAYASQISTFWADLDTMKRSIANYWGWDHGIRLWRRV
ncbi:MAG: PIG-L deacetylase family protein [Acidobacteriaceae bacterium]